MKLTPMRLPSKLLVALSAVLFASCGGGSGTPAAVDSNLYDCTTETRAPPYSAGERFPSVSGAFTGVLVQSVPAPPARDSNSWTVQIVDGTGAPQDGLAMTATPNMPDHNHPVTVKPLVTPANDGTGTYKLDPVYLFMPGYWEVKLSVQPATGPKDTIVLKVCIPS
jgi:hypothetical protein